MKTPEETLATARAWKAANKERQKQYRKKYYAANKQRERAVNESWKAANPEIYRAMKKAADSKYRAENIEKIRAHRASDEYKKNKNQRERERYQNDPRYRMEKRLRAAMTQAMRLYGKGTRKSAAFERLVGCTLTEFMAHIEAQFAEGMSWESDFHIDHIRPCCSFDLTDPEQQRQCFHYSNLRPLSPHENQSKGGRYGNEDSVDP